MSVTQCGSGSGDGDRERDKHTDELVATGTSTNIVYSLCRILYSEIMKAKCFFFHTFIGMIEVVSRCDTCDYKCWFSCFRSLTTSSVHLYLYYTYINIYIVASVHTWSCAVGRAFVLYTYWQATSILGLLHFKMGYRWVGVKIYNLQFS